MQKYMLIFGAAALAVSATAAFAQGAVKPRTAISIECSNRADAKGLHGKERKHFRASCMRSAKAGKLKDNGGMRGYR